MVTKDPIEIWEIKKKSNGDIVSLCSRDGKEIPFEKAKDEIKRGQHYLIGSEDGDNSVIAIVGNHLRTVKDDTELNNLEGNTNLKITIVQ